MVVLAFLDFALTPGIRFFQRQAVFARHRRIVRSRYEWLIVLNCDRWKSVFQAREEMQLLKRRAIDISAAYADFKELRKEGLIVWRRCEPPLFAEQPLTVLEYKLAQEVFLRENRK